MRQEEETEKEGDRRTRKEGEGELDTVGRGRRRPPPSLHRRTPTAGARIAAVVDAGPEPRSLMPASCSMERRTRSMHLLCKYSH